MKPFSEITIKEAKERNLIALEEDYLNSSVDDTSYFSLSPHPDPIKREQGWEKVTYYLARKRASFPDVTNGSEFIYILSNPSLPGLLKIGYTSKNPMERKKELDKATGVPVPFVLEFTKKCINGQQLERAVHNYLECYRVNNRKEFFEISLKDAKTTIDSIYNQLYQPTSPTTT